MGNHCIVRHKIMKTLCQKNEDLMSKDGHKVVLIKILCPRYGLKVFYKNIAKGPYVHLWT